MAARIFFHYVKLLPRKLFFLSTFSMGVWALGFFFFLQEIPKTLPQDNMTTDAIVVLTGGKGRLQEGVNLLAAGRAKKLLLTGVNVSVKMNDLKLYSGELDLNAHKALEDKIVLGYLARNTKQNAYETALWMHNENYQTLRLVTANYHMPRSVLEFRQAMPDKTILPHAVIAIDTHFFALLHDPHTALLVISEFHRYCAIVVQELLQHLSDNA